MKYSKDAEASDMIHMGSDHRCVMATFVFDTPKKDGPCRTKVDRLEKTRQKFRKQADENIGEEESIFET